MEKLKSTLRLVEEGLGEILSATRNILLQLAEFGLFLYGLYWVTHHLLK